MEMSQKNICKAWITITKLGAVKIASLAMALFQLTYCLWTFMTAVNYFITQLVISGAFSLLLLIYRQPIVERVEFQPFYQPFMVGSIRKQNGFFLQTCIVKSYVLYTKASNMLEYLARNSSFKLA